MGNVLDTPEKRAHWNAYNNRYAKKNYKTICIKLNKKEYADVIEYLENDPRGASAVIKKILKEVISGGK